jgi:hypothetical protein
MKRSVSIAALKVMSASRREEEIAELIKSTRRLPNGEIADLDEVIKHFEEQYHVDSETMRARVADGSLAETTDICTWLMTLKLRDRLAKLAARAG